MKTRYLRLILIIIGLLFAGAPMRLIGQPVFIDLYTYGPTEPRLDLVSLTVCSNEVTGDKDIVLGWAGWNGIWLKGDLEGIRIANAQQSEQKVSVFGPGLTESNLEKTLSLPQNILMSGTVFKNSTINFFLDQTCFDACLNKIQAFNQNAGAHTPIGSTELLTSILSAIGFDQPIVGTNETADSLTEAFQNGISGEGIRLRDGREVKRIKAEYRQGLPTQIETNLPGSYIYIGKLEGGQPTGLGRAVFGTKMGFSTYFGTFNAGAKIDGDGTMYFGSTVSKSHFVGCLGNGPTTTTVYNIQNGPDVQTCVLVDGVPRGRVNVTEKLGRKLWWTVDTNGQVHIDLARVTLGTTTGNDDRDHDTGLYVELLDNKNNFIAKMWDGETGGQYGYANHEYHLVDIPIIGHPEKSQCDGFQYRIGIQAGAPTFTGFSVNGFPVLPGNGDDHWEFSATLTLYFSDGTIVFAEKNGQDLNSTGGKLDWGPYTGATSPVIMQVITSLNQQQTL